MMQRFGCSDNDGISPFLKVAITSEDGSLQVMGYIGDGAAWSMVGSWESPFENASLGSIAGLGATANLIQAGAMDALPDSIKSFMSDTLGIESQANQQGLTSISTMNSLMVWEGNRPPSISMPVHFVAREDAAIEVQGALLALNQMISPELGAATPGGRAPQKVIINVGRMVALTGCALTAVNIELDAPRTSQGYFTHNTVSLEITGSAVANASVLPQIFSMSPI